MPVSKRTAEAVEQLLAVMAALRDPSTGCPWDLAQTSQSIARYTIEEAHEVVEAIENGSPGSLRDELGDLLFQVVFHARMAEEAGNFDFADVVAGISAKMTRRHPHVFAPASGTSDAGWEAIKNAERIAAGGDSSALAGIPLSLPALARATKLGSRAAGVGFDWPDVEDVVDKLREELAELEVARHSGHPDAVAEELGDLLFTCANLARHLRTDPEQVLRAANRKFEERVRALEAGLLADGRAWTDVTPAELEIRWTAIKKGTVKR
jgi:MazG family protein